MEVSSDLFSDVYKQDIPCSPSTLLSILARGPAPIPFESHSVGSPRTLSESLVHSLGKLHALSTFLVTVVTSTQGNNETQAYFLAQLHDCGSWRNIAL